MPRDIEKVRAARRRYYDRNKELYFEKNKRRREELRQLSRIAKDKPCADCGQRFPPYVMDLDHRTDCDKVLEVAQMIALNWSKEKVLAEIEKCDVVCANCHRIRTFTRGQYKGRWRVV
jgi:hypothetical protein